MAEKLMSVGLDVGTTTTQMILSQITVQNQAGHFAVPEMKITDRQILYKSPVHFTPLKGETLVDGDGISRLVAQEYQNAGISPQQVDSGAVIITGESSRKENAAAVLQSLSSFAGEFVVATAGPDLESLLAAKGAGAEEYAAKTGETVLHIDIGGGTSNMALIENGKVVRTGCLNVGGRLLKLDGEGRICYISPVLKGLCDLSLGQLPTPAQTEAVAQMLCRALEMAAGRIPAGELLKKLSTDEVQTVWQPPKQPVTVSFSGGVADCIEKNHPPRAFGDIGPELGKAIKESSLCQGPFVLAQHTIRATVIGAGCHSTQLSGSTVFCRNMALPKKNLPVLLFTGKEQESPDFARIIAERLSQTDSRSAVLAMPGLAQPDYTQIGMLAQKIAQGVGSGQAIICLQADMAKALGQRLSLLLPDSPCICLDRLSFGEQCYLDIGAPVGPCFPVVIKTLILSQ